MPALIQMFFCFLLYKYCFCFSLIFLFEIKSQQLHLILVIHTVYEDFKSQEDKKQQQKEQDEEKYTCLILHVLLCVMVCLKLVGYLFAHYFLEVFSNKCMIKIMKLFSISQLWGNKIPTWRRQYFCCNVTYL